MDKDIVNHSINIIERKNISINGVKKIDNFDDKEFLLETSMGYLKVQGSDLEIIKLDTILGSVSIKGKINNVIYIEEVNKKEESLFSKLFK